MKSGSSNGKKTFEKISILINLILIPIILGAASFAWFSSNRDVSARGMTVEIEEGVSIDAELFSYGISNITDSSYTVDMSEEKYELPLRDPNGILFSKYQLALLIKIEMTVSEPTKVELYAETLITDIPIEKDTIRENYISNCVTLTPATFDEATNVAQISGEAKSFTSVDDEGMYTKSKTKLQLFSGDISAGTHTLYFLMEYNESFLEFIDPYVMEHWLEEPTVTYSHDLKFAVYGDRS